MYVSIIKCDTDQMRPCAIDILEVGTAVDDVTARELGISIGRESQLVPDSCPVLTARY